MILVIFYDKSGSTNNSLMINQKEWRRNDTDTHPVLLLDIKVRHEFYMNSFRLYEKFFNLRWSIFVSPFW